MNTRTEIAHRPYGHRRLTPQRAAIACVASSMHGAFTVEELAAAVSDTAPEASATATIYRAVAAMEAAGFLTRVGERSGSALYARCGADAHHHHIVCDGCGRVAHTACPLDVGATRDATATDGFVITRHEVTLYGLCPACVATGRSA